MTEIPTATCIYCTERPADGEDKHCAKCRAEQASQSLINNLTDALENFLDDRWAPHRHGYRPSYYLTRPAFDDATFDRIEAAYNQIVAGARQLIDWPWASRWRCIPACGGSHPHASWASSRESSGDTPTTKTRATRPGGSCSKTGNAYEESNHDDRNPVHHRRFQEVCVRQGAVPGVASSRDDRRLHDRSRQMKTRCITNSTS